MTRADRRGEAGREIHHRRFASANRGMDLWGEDERDGAKGCQLSLAFFGCVQAHGVEDERLEGGAVDGVVFVKVDGTNRVAF